MKKEGINYVLLNSALLFFIVYILQKLNVLNTFIEIIILIILSLLLSYLIYPLYKLLSNKMNNILSIILIYLFLFIILFLLIYSVIPNHLITKITELFTNLLKFENIIKNKLNISVDLNFYIEKLVTYILKNGILIISNIINYISKFIFISILSMCIILNINYIKKLVDKTKYKTLLYRINNKLKYYIIANIKIMIIQFIEYTAIFLLIGHPNYLLLGVLNALNTFIPFIGILFTDVIALTTSIVISKKLFILTSIICVLMPQIDAYLITPKIYKNTNNIPQTLYISSVIIFTSLLGFYGIILSLPILIIIIEILKYKNIVKEDFK